MNNKPQRDQRNLNAPSGNSYRPNNGGGQNYPQPGSGSNQGAGTQRPGFYQPADRNKKCAEPSQTNQCDPKREQKVQTPECDNRNNPKDLQKKNAQISKEEKNRAEAPSQEDWEGGASRPETERKQQTWDAARQQNKQENRERPKAVGNESEFEADDEDVRHPRTRR